MAIAVTGAGGQLGRELCRRLGAEGTALDRQGLDLTQPQLIQQTLAKLRPVAVINAGAYTAVDRAEQESELCWQVNATAVEHVAAACRQLDIPLLQVSTDYVYSGYPSGQRPWTEADPPAAVGVYARSKLAGEAAAASWEKSYIVRTCGLYGPLRPGAAGGNFVETMLRLGRQRDQLRIVADQHCTPTSITDLAAALVFLIRSEQYGLYHITNGDETTWYDFAQEIFRLAEITVTLERISTPEYGAPAPRPAYSVLDTSKYHALGGPVMPSWEEALAAYLKQRATSE